MRPIQAERDLAQANCQGGCELAIVRHFSSCLRRDPSRLDHHLASPDLSILIQDDETDASSLFFVIFINVDNQPHTSFRQS